jgi:hypothetical protein
MILYNYHNNPSTLDGYSKKKHVDMLIDGGVLNHHYLNTHFTNDPEAQQAIKDRLEHELSAFKHVPVNYGTTWDGKPCIKVNIPSLVPAKNLGALIGLPVSQIESRIYSTLFADGSLDKRISHLIDTADTTDVLYVDIYKFILTDMGKYGYSLPLTDKSAALATSS